MKTDPIASQPPVWKTPDIMATVGPTLEKEEDLLLAIEAGARWFRFPCGYRQRPHLENARAVRAASHRAGISVQILLDLPSSRPRTGSMPELRLAPGAKVIFKEPVEGHPEIPANGVHLVPLPGLSELLPKMLPHQRLWFCDGRVRFLIDEVRSDAVLAHLVLGTVPLKSSNSIHLPDSHSPYKTVTAEDVRLLHSLAKAGVEPDWLALSLIASAEDVVNSRQECTRLLGHKLRIMAKFETVAAVEHAESIIAASDGIMVARGDLGMALGYISLPQVQEELVRAARRAGRSTVVATQVLEVFAETGLPQRAELSDLSLIALQRADAVMLGKETVFSPRPIECIRFAHEVLAHETRRFEEASRKHA